jgi:hypothetical protein
VTDDGRRVTVVDRATSGLATLAFVLGVITLSSADLGAVALAVGVPSRGLGAIFLAVGLVFGGLTALVLRAIKRRRAQPLGSCHSVAILDRKLRLITVAGGGLLPLDQVRFERRMQMGSSSPKLVAVTPRGTRVLKRGNPFDGGIGSADQVLNAVLQGTRT